MVGLGAGVGVLAVTSTVAEAFLDRSATLVAVTVAVVATFTAGATNKPVLEMVPAVADQVTPTLLVSRTVAVNCWVLPEETVGLAGEMCTLMFGPAGAPATARVNSLKPKSP